MRPKKSYTRIIALNFSGGFVEADRFLSEQPSTFTDQMRAIDLELDDQQVYEVCSSGKT